MTNGCFFVVGYIVYRCVWHDLWQEEGGTLLLQASKEIDSKLVKKEMRDGFIMDSMPPPLPRKTAMRMPDDCYILPDTGINMEHYGGIEEFMGGWSLGPSQIEFEDIDMMDEATKKLLLGKKTVTLKDGTVLKDQETYAQYISPEEKRAMDVGERSIQIF